MTESAHHKEPPGLTDSAAGVSPVPERFRSTSAPAWHTREYLNEWAGPRQCEVSSRSGGAHCPNAAEYALTVRDRTGYICGACVGEHVRVNAKYGTVTVERLK